MAPTSVLVPEGGGTSQRLPAWQAAAVLRLVFVARLAILFGGIATAMLWLQQDNVGIRAGHARPNWPVPAWVVLSAAMAWALGRDDLRDERKVDVGLVWLVSSCLLVGIFRHGLPYAASDVVRGVSPVAVLLLLFSVVVPVPPRRLLVAVALGCLMDPAALVFLVGMGAPAPPWNVWLWLHAPDLFAVPLAWVTASTLFDLRERAVREAELGAYRLERLLGVGGMGEVWVARHRRLAQPVAIKIVRPPAVSVSPMQRRDAVARFEREARVTAKLRSPHTVRVFDFGTTDEGVFYYAMELLDGVDLERLVDDVGPLPPRRAVHLLLQVCDALSEAHDMGLVHRDIKPANVMVSQRGASFDVVTVLDFGLARETRGPDAVSLTAAGSVLGSPIAMAPELATGGEATAASDLYGLGCLAVWLISGEHLFRADSIPALLLAHTATVPPPLSSRTSSTLPAGLDELVAELVAKPPSDRPASVDEVIVRLRALDLPVWTPAEAAACWTERSDTSPATDADPTASDVLATFQDL